MAVTREQIATKVKRGLAEAWYPVLPSWRLQDAPVGITRLSQNIAVWRDKDGSVHAIEDRCPHRGARLSLGWNLGDRLACWYHGVEVNFKSTIISVPAMEACEIEGRTCGRAYPALERNGAIFLWFGAGEAPALELPEEMVAPEYDGFLTCAHWNCNYMLAIENVMDPMHGAYLHAQSHSMAEGDKQAKMQIVPTKTGFMFEKAGQRGVNFDWVEWGESGAFWMRLAIPYQKRFGGGDFTIVGFTTPVDEDNCLVFFWRIRKSEGWARDVWRFMYKTKLEGLHWNVLEQDRVVLENLAPEETRTEWLYAHDAGVTRIRSLMANKARKELQADEARAASASASNTETVSA
jgi:phenylpropionate dioxygenase-like ring-hydroxylating dioxygenase large terminal subunit